MRSFFRPLLILVFVFLVPLPVWSIIIETKTGETIRGVVVQEDDFRLAIRTEGSKKLTFVPKDQILHMIRMVDPKKLEKLSPKNPREYFSLADKLITEGKDPEARETALRLYLIAAYLDPDNLGQIALSRMSLFVRSSGEAKALRGLAYLHDRLKDKSFLEKKDLNDDKNPKAKKNFLLALQRLRRGKTEEALEFASLSGVADLFSKIPGLMSYSEFVKLCREFPECSCKTGREFCRKCGGKGIPNCPDCKGLGWYFCEKCNGKPRRLELPPGQEELILHLELEYETKQNGLPGKKDSEEEMGWGEALSSGTLRPLPVLSLEYVTKFDPRKCIFREGQWVTPE